MAGGSTPPAQKRTRNQEMAARLKKEHVFRGSRGRCPICHNVVDSTVNHLPSCKGPHRKGTNGTNFGCERPR